MACMDAASAGAILTVSEDGAWWGMLCGAVLGGCGWNGICTFFGGEDGRGFIGVGTFFGFTTAAFGFRLACIGEAWNNLRQGRAACLATACLASREVWMGEHCRNGAGSCNRRREGVNAREKSPDMLS